MLILRAFRNSSLGCNRSHFVIKIQAPLERRVESIVNVMRFGRSRRSSGNVWLPVGAVVVTTLKLSNKNRSHQVAFLCLLSYQGLRRYRIHTAGTFGLRLRKVVLRCRKAAFWASGYLCRYRCSAPDSAQAISRRDGSYGACRTRS